MNTTPSLRSFGFALIVNGVIAVLILLWHARSERSDTNPISDQALCPCVDPIPNSGTCKQATGLSTVNSLAFQAPATLTDEAAKAELRKNGQYESLGAALAAARHAVGKIDPAGPHSRSAEYYANNPGQQLRAWFSNDGVELASGIPTPEGEEPWSMKLRLRGVGRGDKITPVSAGTTTGNGNRIEIAHCGAVVTQWFENRKEGLEQGITLQQPPTGKAGELAILLQVEGNLQVERMQGNDAARFVDAAGAEVLRYTGLKAWDEAGHPLAARIEVGGSGSIILVVADAGARYPVTIDPLFANVEARLVEESVAGDYFGCSVAISGDTVLVGAHGADTASGADAGSAYVFARTGATWAQQAKLTAGDGASGDHFGYSVALSGDTSLVGKYVFVRSGDTWSQQAKLTSDDGALTGSHVALSGDTALIDRYVFVRSGTNWTQQFKLVAADGVSSVSSVALAGDTAAIGASGDDTVAGVDAGSVYVFVRSGTLWIQQGKLVADDPVAYAEFGTSVALSGDTALVGAMRARTISGKYAGGAYVFMRSGTTWSQQTKLTAIDGEAEDNFGASVALADNTALVGASGDDTVVGEDAGSVYVYVGGGAVWSLQAKLVHADAAPADAFGAAVAISGNTALVGAPGNALNFAYGTTSYRGRMYEFARSDTMWTQKSMLAADDAATGDLFGFSVALAGDTALVGAFFDDAMEGENAGSAYVFVRSGSTWSQQAEIKAGDPEKDAWFGISVALSGNTALVGAERGDNRGSAYIFVRSGTAWRQQAKLTSSDRRVNDDFGTSVALDGDTALVGMDRRDGWPPGCYVFVRSGTTWSQQDKLTANDTVASDNFGIAVALCGDTALIGASGDDTAAGADAGSAYVFVRSAGVWDQQAKLAGGDAAAHDWFGSSVALDGDSALIGAPCDSATAAGRAYVFVRNGSVWSQQAKLTAGDATAGNQFGFAVAISADTALVGAYGDDTAAGVDAGSAYVFVRSGTTWNPQVKLNAAFDASQGDRFGASVALSGGNALIGAWEDGTAGFEAGSAYVFLLGELPVITQHPVPHTVVPMQSVTFNITAAGHAPLRYQWRKDGSSITGATSTSYTIPSAQLVNQGSYDCVVSNIGGVVTSAPAVLAVNALSQFSQSFPGAPPEALGYVLVTLTPSDIGGWRFVGEQQWRQSGFPAGALTTGDRQIEFRPVPGYIQPPTETVSVTSGSVTSLEGDYYLSAVSGSGGLNVFLKPNSLVGAGLPVAERAQWRFFGEDDSHWRDSGETANGLMEGIYLLECKQLEGRTIPPPASVLVENNATGSRTLTYLPEESPVGTAASVVPFETASGDTGMPYAYVGQIRSRVGSSTGFVVKRRVVATAGHVVFDDGTLAAVAGLQWLFQSDRASQEPKPQEPRGYYLFTGYSAQRTLENTPGTSSPQSHELDVAALYFTTEDAGRGGFSGFLASDATDNEFLLSAANKVLVGYPVNGIAAPYQGRMHATPAANVGFAHGGSTHTYITSGIRSSGGASGGPLCVQFEGGNYYPAAIYLGGSGQTVVRSIDSQVIELFDRAEVSGNGGGNNTGGGITHSSVTGILDTAKFGSLKVILEPAAEVMARAGWKRSPKDTYYQSGTLVGSLTAGTYILEFTTVPGFQTPTPQTVTITGGQTNIYTYTYEANIAAPVIASATWTEGQRNQSLNYQISANPEPTSYSLTGTLPAGLVFDPTTGLINGTLQEAGIFIVTVGATNGGGSTTTNLSITSKPAISNQTAAASLGEQANFQIASSESGAGVTHSAYGLPQGLTIDPASGLVTGMPLQAGFFPCLINVSKRGANASAILTLTVSTTPLALWRLAKFGTSANAGTAADTEDPDHDGQPNISEYAAGTNPNDASDVLKVLTTARTGLTFTLTTAGKAGRTYCLQRKTDLGAGTWDTLGTRGPLAADDTVNLTDKAAPDGNAFYRIQASVP